MKQSGMLVADLGKNHSSEAFYGCNDPLESVIFSAFLEMQKLQDGEVPHVDP